LSKINHLQLQHNQIRDISPIANLRELNKLTINNNRIRRLPDLSALTNLHCLIANDNQIDRLPDMTTLGRLQSLILSNNRIRDISPLASIGSASDYYKAPPDMYALRLEGNPLNTAAYIKYLPLLEKKNRRLKCYRRRLQFTWRRRFIPWLSLTTTRPKSSATLTYDPPATGILRIVGVIALVALLLIITILYRRRIRTTGQKPIVQS
jgi:Leucine-rich repeat (LRR) protein